MEKLNIICVDDQREVLSAVVKDLEPLRHVFNIEECESADECIDLMDELDAEGQHIALVISDHVMPGKSGVELLTELANDNRFERVKKVLLTGLATHKDTIDAVNRARIEHYFEKPWNPDELLLKAKKLITEYVLKAGLDYESYTEGLDIETLYANLH